MFGSGEAWHDVFVPTHSMFEMFVRGTTMYLVIFALLRFVLKRQSGGFSTPDLLLVVLLADAAQNGMADEYRSITEGVVVVAPSFSGTSSSTGCSAAFRSWNGCSGPRPC